MDMPTALALHLVLVLLLVKPVQPGYLPTVGTTTQVTGCFGTSITSCTDNPSPTESTTSSTRRRNAITTTNPITHKPMSTMSAGPLKISNGILQEYADMRNTLVEDDNLWQLNNTHLLQCGRYCLKDHMCSSVFFDANLTRCTAHGKVYDSGSPVTNVKYFVVMFI